MGICGLDMVFGEAKTLLEKKSPSYITQAIQAIRDLPLDPLYVSILVALAQRSRATASSHTPARPQKVSLFVSEHTKDTLLNVQSHASSPPAWITSLKQYTATITDEYLQKFDDPYHFHASTLHIYQTSYHINSPATIFQAMKAGSRTPNLSLDSSTTGEKRKALSEITKASTQRIKNSSWSRMEWKVGSAGWIDCGVDESANARFHDW